MVAMCTNKSACILVITRKRKKGEKEMNITHPSKRQTNKDVQPTCNQETSKIVCSAGNRRYKDCVSNNADKGSDDTEYSSLLGTIRQPGCAHVGGSAKEIAGDSQKLNLSSRPSAQSFDDSRQESRETLRYG